MQVLVGSYSIPSPWASAPSAHGAGIVAMSFDQGDEPGDGPGLLVDGAPRFEVNPSFLALDESGAGVWAVTEPERGGELLRFGLDPRGGLAAAPPVRIDTGSDAPCHVALGPGAALVSHYHGGVVSVVARDASGAPERLAQSIALPEAGEGWDRRDAVSRPHAAMFLPGGATFAVADCGRDLVALYRWDRAAGRAELRQTVPLEPGTGPRHLAWHAGSRSILVSNQNGGGVTVLGAAGARLEVRQVLPGRGLGRRPVVPSEIAVHPGGAHAVLANRGDDSLTVFDIDARGALTERLSVDSGGRGPRHFAFSPDGSALLVAHQDSDEATAFRWERGQPADPVSVAVATPTAVLIVPERRLRRARES